MSYTEAFNSFETLNAAAFDNADNAQRSSDRENLMFRLRRIAYSRPNGNKRISDQQILELLEAAALAEQTLSEQQERIRFLETLSITDELTGLLNRRGFQRELDRTLNRAARTSEQGVLVICDMDYFKSINDTYGHLAGDCVLKKTAHTLVKHCRKSDYIARLSGDEFAVLMTNTPAGQVVPVISKLSKVLNRLIVDWGQHKIPVSVSVGHETYTASSTSSHLLYMADRSMYLNKGTALTKDQSTR
ncbi:GGDEF domain-containing protein [Kiloniella laminariae]|uniref:diguanylate cyclase n=1 Tax=Kiloniella laminariae TaxID=454162 RepID=A0ABT4LGX1_9PROT|nr:GGDEF domain-containing protein [Kiloniella laminariae]MCZ4280357.1 GGDEF domain-containing protein [Kiloniella laminariae]